MIRPNMATMLGFIATDAQSTHAARSRWPSTLADRSFNRVTIDGDTSTNDSFMLIATGKAAHADDHLARSHRGTRRLREAMHGRRPATGASRSCATAKARPNSSPSGRRRARRRANAGRSPMRSRHSPLVKTAFFASRSEPRPHPGGHRLRGHRRPRRRRDRSVSGRRARGGKRRSQSGLPRGRRPARHEEERDRGARRARPRRRAATVWTCDLSHDYVSINADYRS